MPTKVLNFMTPLDSLKSYFPHTQLGTPLPLKIFGCTVYVHISQPGQSKLAPRAQKCVFVGYSANQKGYKCFNPTTKKLIVSMDVTFLEHQPYFSKTPLQGESSGGKEECFWFSVPQTIDSVAPTIPVSTIPISNSDSLSKVDPVVSEVFEMSNNTKSTSQPSPVPTVVLSLSPTKPESSTKLGSQPPGESSTSPTKVVESVAGGDTLLRPKELITYSRRKGHQREAAVPLSPVQFSSPNSVPGMDSNPSAINPHPTDSSVHPKLIFYDLDLPIALRKGRRNIYPIFYYLSYDRLSENHKSYLAKLSDTFVPKDITEALGNLNWRKAVKEEIDALEKNGTWDIVDTPRNHKIVGCKWVFTIKQKADGSIERYKARLVAKGFTQTLRIDYEETFAPVAKMNSIRVLFSLAACFDWPLYQLDVKNAFLNGILEEEVYMRLPPGFETGKNKVCKLKKALYGLKQSPKAWFNRFGKVIKGFGYIQSQADHTLFHKQSLTGKISVIIVYVDDIIVTGNDQEAISELKKKLAQSFEIKDLGPVKYFLGMEVARSNHGIFVNQRKYVLDLLKETGLENCKPAETPLDANQKLELAKLEEVVDIGKFQ